MSGLQNSHSLFNKVVDQSCLTDINCHCCQDLSLGAVNRLKCIPVYDLNIIDFGKRLFLDLTADRCDNLFGVLLTILDQLFAKL